LDQQVLLAVHDEQLAEHGGGAGTRAPDLLESALPKPRNLASCGKPDAAALAAAYGCGIARNRPFVADNKRTALVAVELFFLLNGLDLKASDEACVLTMLAVSEGGLAEASFAQWLREHARARQPCAEQLLRRPPASLPHARSLGMPRSLRVRRLVSDLAHDALQHTAGRSPNRQITLRRARPPTSSR
jgi:death-on-curing protein